MGIVCKEENKYLYATLLTITSIAEKHCVSGLTS